MAEPALAFDDTVISVLRELPESANEATTAFFAAVRGRHLNDEVVIALAKLPSKLLNQLFGELSEPPFSSFQFDFIKAFENLANRYPASDLDRPLAVVKDSYDFYDLHTLFISASYENAAFSKAVQAWGFPSKKPVRTTTSASDEEIPKSSSTGNDPWREFERSQETALTAYGRCKPERRITEAARSLIPYVALMFSLSVSLNITISRLFSDLGSLLLHVAYAQTAALPTTTRQDVVFYVLLCLFVASFGVTLSDEFFTDKPRPISRDLNRAFIGFLIGQMGKLLAV